MKLNGRIFLSNCCALFLFFVSIIIPATSTGQIRKFNNKLSPVLAEKIYSARIVGSGKNLFRITTAGKDLPFPLRLQKFNARKVAEYNTVSFYMIHATATEMVDSILPLSSVLFIDDGTRIPKEEGQLNNLDLGVNKINVVHQKFSQWNGAGLTLSLKEDKPDTTDIDIAGRFLTTTLSSPTFSTHATNMATMIAGAGNSWYTGKGAAWASTISSSDFANLLPDPTASLQLYNITVQNHSYGVGVENFYGADAAAYDESLISNPFLVNVFSSGNSGELAASTGPYSGINGFANLTGSFKMAKNIITVGATDSFSNVATQSSKGPTGDGRIKPELVAFGIDGSSGAAALVSGVALLLQQQFKQMNGSMPANALIKAVLLNSADDRGNTEVDYSNGFGSLNALNSIRTIEAGRYFNGTVSNGGEQKFSLAVPPGIKKLKITLAWNDPPATANTTKALVNDLDLELLNPITMERWQPWVLNHFPQIDSLKQPATRKKDSVNNVEQITVDGPAAGVFQVSVKGYAVTSSPQTFFIAYQFDSTDIFEWHFPAAYDPVFSSSINTVRWNSSYESASGKLDYSIDNGLTWQLIDPAVDLAKGYFIWNTPPVISPSLLRMTIGTHQIISDTFVIAARTQLGVGFDCPDSLLLYWNKQPLVNNYRLYKLGNLYMEPILLTTDSTSVLQKNTNPSFYYAVAPVIAGKEGVRSNTINYTFQGVGCYIRSFLSDLVNNTVTLSLSLGSLYHINKIILEKFDGSGFKPLQQLLNNTSLVINFSDDKLTRGLNIYRIKLELAGGGMVYSLDESVFYFDDSRYVIYPNPAPRYGEINIAQANVDVALMQVFNVSGVKVFEKVLDDRINKIPAGKLSTGLYFIRVMNNGKQVETLKLIVH